MHLGDCIRLYVLGLSSSSTSTWLYTIYTAHGTVGTIVSADPFCRVNKVIIIIITIIIIIVIISILLFLY